MESKVIEQLTNFASMRIEFPTSQLEMWISKSLLILYYLVLPSI